MSVTLLYSLHKVEIPMTNRKRSHSQMSRASRSSGSSASTTHNSQTNKPDNSASSSQNKTNVNTEAAKPNKTQDITQSQDKTSSSQAQETATPAGNQPTATDNKPAAPAGADASDSKPEEAAPETKPAASENEGADADNSAELAADPALGGAASASAQAPVTPAEKKSKGLLAKIKSAMTPDIVKGLKPGQMVRLQVFGKSKVVTPALVNGHLVYLPDKADLDPSNPEDKEALDSGMFIEGEYDPNDPGAKGHKPMDVDEVKAFRQSEAGKSPNKPHNRKDIVYDVDNERYLYPVEDIDGKAQEPLPKFSKATPEERKQGKFVPDGAVTGLFSYDHTKAVAETAIKKHQANEEAKQEKEAIDKWEKEQKEKIEQQAKEEREKVDKENQEAIEKAEKEGKAALDKANQQGQGGENSDTEATTPVEEEESDDDVIVTPIATSASDTIASNEQDNTGTQAANEQVSDEQGIGGSNSAANNNPAPLTNIDQAPASPSEQAQAQEQQPVAANADPATADNSEDSNPPEQAAGEDNSNQARSGRVNNGQTAARREERKARVNSLEG
jgi:hypothetical protein